jgi:hypothetical protein
MKTEKRDYRYGVIKKPEFASERTSGVLEREGKGRSGVREQVEVVRVFEEL